MSFLKNRKILKLVSNQYHQDLSDVILVGCQHILGTTVNLLDELIRNGLKKPNIFLIGKCYSTNLQTFNRIRKKGIYIDNNSLTFDGKMSFDEQFKDYVSQFIINICDKISQTKYKKIILLDDGGQLIELFNKNNRVDLQIIRAVEQTSSGYDKIKNLSLNIPVINVARSSAKLEIESPIIAEVVVKNIRKYFKKYRMSDPKILIVGSGYVGDKIMNLLSKSFQVDSYDLVTHDEPFPGSFASKLHDYQVIVGVTGQRIMTEKDYHLLESGTHLISSSSSDREFSAWNFRKQLKYGSCHADAHLKGITVANCGFPINFTGEKHSAPPSQIMLTRALLLAGIFEANQIAESKGLVDLPKNIQKYILSKYKA